MSGENWDLITDQNHVLCPRVDQFRFRHIDENGQWTEWGNWNNVFVSRTVAEWISKSPSEDWQFRKPKEEAAKFAEPQPPQQTQPQDDWEFINDDNHKLRVGIDQIRWRMYDSETGIWTRWTAWESAHSAIRVGDLPRFSTEWLCRKPKRQPEAKPIDVDRGERYRREIVKSLPGPYEGVAVTVDIADIVEAFNMPYMLAQAAKKIMLPGERGSKDRLRDLREAAWHINRQIQIEEAKNNGK